MKAPEVGCYDFETLPIGQRPAYPPAPVGVALQWPHEERPTYWRFGHPTGNNCDERTAREKLREMWDSGLPLLAHYQKFDSAVAGEKWGLPEKRWQDLHDTLFLSFMENPHGEQGLKPLAESLLGEPPDEQDAVVDWVMAHAAQLPKLPNKKGELKGPSRSEHPKDGVFAGAWIAWCPGDLVDPYACGDVRRAKRLFEHLWPLVHMNGMGPAYDRERRCLPVFMDNERAGLRTDQAGLERDVEVYGRAMDSVEDALRQVLRASGLNFDADADVASILLERGIVPRENWGLTPTGKLSVKKDVLLPEHFTGENGAAIASVLGYRNRLKTCLDMFMRPWLAQASVNKGYITTNWNQTRGTDAGTRTGRPSTNHHNFLNISKTWDGRDDGYVHPEFLGVPPLPLVRKYVLPDDGGTFLHRDFDGQEMRVFGDGAEGALKAAYTADPKLDPHAFVGEELMRVADRPLDRTKIKTLNFQSLYGGGVPALQNKLRCSIAEAKELKALHDQALPDRKVMVEVIKSIARRGDPIRTWGGRLYFCEPAKMIDGRRREMDYKLINVYCQGSAADLTKEALACWWEEGYQLRKQGVRFLVTVYDEINISAPVELAQQAMDCLHDVMERPRLDIAMLSSGKRGPNWGTLEKCA